MTWFISNSKRIGNIWPAIIIFEAMKNLIHFVLFFQCVLLLFVRHKNKIARAVFFYFLNCEKSDHTWWGWGCCTYWIYCSAARVTIYIFYLRKLHNEHGGGVFHLSLRVYLEMVFKWWEKYLTWFIYYFF